MNYVGIDHDRQDSHIAWRAEKGGVVKSGIIPNDGMRQNRCMNAHSAGAAENEMLIFPRRRWCINLL